MGLRPWVCCKDLRAMGGGGEGGGDETDDFRKFS